MRPGAGVGAPGAGFTRAPGVNPGGLGGPASGAGVRPGAGFGAPGVGLTRAPGARGAWNPAWGQRGYWGSRPWRVGWYRVNPVAWNWWGPSSLTWGATSLATAAAVSSMVDQAVAAQATAFTVPSTSYQLDYASLQAVAPYGASFHLPGGGSPCRAGGLPAGVAQWRATELGRSGPASQCRLPGGLRQRQLRPEAQPFSLSL
ncbi:hypothetical protein [Cyanobium sp. ATX-6F1]|uniref:hypothetical protein n=1 Tax=Cyanobium sp. ATX-6F1 TaxID=3137388 RepID=UPI0039BE49A8